MDAPGEAVRMWGRLGYPRRALRLHQRPSRSRRSTTASCPPTIEALRALPGIGDYTAAAVAAFAYRQRHVVLDTNVRRVLSRVIRGVEFPAKHLTAAERELATEVLPDDPETAARWSVGVMELGALVCSAARRDAPLPAGRAMPLATQRLSRRTTVRHVEARLTPAPIGNAAAGSCNFCATATIRSPEQSIEPVWDDPIQRDRALASLVDDGLVVAAGDRRPA